MTESDLKQKILLFFRKNKEQYVSGEDISRSLEVSRAYVWKYMSKLRDDGYAIDAVPRLGYKIRSVPDKLFGYEIKNGLKTRVIGKKEIYHYEAIDSTNNRAYELAEELAPEGTIVVAESQTHGKGRIGRKWVSPKSGGIYMSLILRPDVETDEVPSVTLVAAVAIIRAIKDITGIDVRMKWPNDILCGKKKVCGILTEIKAQPDRVDFLILGAGINVNTPVGKLPAGSTSLKDETGYSINRAQLMRQILEELENNYKKFQKKGFTIVRSECKRLSSVLGKNVRIKAHHHIIEGKAIDIDKKGALIVWDGNCERRRVFSGDVSVVSQ